MPFGSFFKKFFKKSTKELATKYGGEDAGNLVDGAVDAGFAHLRLDEKMDGMLNSFTGGQQEHLLSLFGEVEGDPVVMEKTVSKKGLDPALVGSVISMISGGGGAGGGGGGASGGGFDIGSLIQTVASLTKGGGGSGGAGVEGFLSLIMNAAGGGGGGTSSTNNILQVIIGLAKSFFATQTGKNPALQDWGSAGARGNGDLTSWAMALVRDLIFPGKKAKDVIDEDPGDKPNPQGKEGIKGWFDNHPEIGKMQKDVFDDIFDTRDDDDENRLVDDPTPVIPIPRGFKEDCSILDKASILFLNNKILLDLRKEWRFCYSTKTNAQDFDEFFDLIALKGPTLMIIQDSDGNVFGAFTSTSWSDSQGGWMGNGDSFIFSLKPKMAVFYSTGKDDNIMYCSRDEGLGLGGRVGRHGLSISTSLASGTYHEDVDTFDLPPMMPEEFDISHIEVWALGPETDESTESSKLHIRRANTNITRNRGVDMDDLMGQIS